MSTTVTSDMTWLDRAACKGVHKFTEQAEAVQQQWCAVCPVRDQCRDLGLSTHRDHIITDRGKPSRYIGGVFGGMTAGQLADAIREKAGR